MNSDSQSAPQISILIPVYNAQNTLPRCLTAVFQSEYTNFECLLVDDGSTDGSPQAAVQEYDIQLIELIGKPHGPAYARNVGAKKARGDILFFIDADVVIYPDSLTKVAQSFAQNPQIDALFGSYDTTPGDTNFLSQYRNLQHHFVHQIGYEDASTFWSGCGAMKRELFLKMGGFDIERYPRPSIEDIELGYRLKRDGRHILLNKNLQVKHLKRWSLKGMLKTDIFDRAIPWTLLIMQERNLPNDLNLQTSQRISAFLACLSLLLMGIGILLGQALFPTLLLLFLSLLDNWQWQTQPIAFKKSAAGLAASVSLLLISGGLAYLQGVLWLLPLLGIVLAALLLGRLLKDTAVTPLFHIATAVPALTLLIAFTAYPVWLALPLLLSLAVLILLNRNLYQFFWRERGWAFATAVVPLQILYYLYSTLAFIVSIFIHYRQAKGKAYLSVGTVDE
ncbi:MAG: glycosyltransferase family 2 protein [Chloroflexi bacterium]|nr:glycosyltransferase family 2 protein [Chloroflexota bacterium]